MIFYVLPSGDPAVLRAGHFPNPAMLAHIRHVLGLDKPFCVQYWIYIRGIVLHFNLGYSYQFAQPVRTMIFDRLPATISLTVGAVAIWLSDRHGGRERSPPSAAAAVLDRLTMIGSLLAISAPTYLAGSDRAVPVLNGHRRDPHLRRRRHVRRAHRRTPAAGSAR